MSRRFSTSGSRSRRRATRRKATPRMPMSSARFREVVPIMRGARHYFKVGRAIILLVAVAVMHDFGWPQSSSEYALHDETVLQNIAVAIRHRMLWSSEFNIPMLDPAASPPVWVTSSGRPDSRKSVIAVQRTGRSFSLKMRRIARDWGSTHSAWFGYLTATPIHIRTITSLSGLVNV